MSASIIPLVPECYVNESFEGFAEAYDVLWNSMLGHIETLPQDTVFPDTTKLLEQWLADKGNPLQLLLSRVPADRLRPLACILLWWYANRGTKEGIKRVLETIIPNLTVFSATGIETCWKLGDSVRGRLGITTVLLDTEQFVIYVSRTLTPDELSLVQAVVRFCIPAHFYVVIHIGAPPVTPPPEILP